MSPETLATIVARLEKLERQNRRLKAGGIALLCIVSSVALIAARPARSAEPTIVGSKFSLVNASGKQVAALESDVNDLPGLSFSDPSGKERIWIGFFGKGAESSEPGVAFYDDKKVERLWAGINEKANPRVVIYDKDHKEVWTTPSR